jgi:hypothetical protein
MGDKRGLVQTVHSYGNAARSAFVGMWSTSEELTAVLFASDFCAPGRIQYVEFPRLDYFHTCRWLLLPHIKNVFSNLVQRTTMCGASEKKDI